MPASGGADFFVAAVAEVVVRVLARGRRWRRVRERRRALLVFRARTRDEGIGRFGHGVGGAWRRGDHFVVFGVVGGVAAGGVDGDEVVSLVEGAADQVEPAEEHGGSAYEDKSPDAIELGGEKSASIINSL